MRNNTKTTLSPTTNGHLLELIKTEFARRFENEDTATCGLGEVANIWNKTVKPTNIPGTLWEHYSIPAFDAEQYPMNWVTLLKAISMKSFQIQYLCQSSIRLLGGSGYRS